MRCSQLILTPLATSCTHFTSSYFMKPSEANIARKILGLLGLALWSNNSNFLVLILHRSWGIICPVLMSYDPTVQNIHKTFTYMYCITVGFTMQLKYSRFPQELIILYPVQTILPKLTKVPSRCRMPEGTDTGG